METQQLPDDSPDLPSQEQDKSDRPICSECGMPVRSFALVCGFCDTPDAQESWSMAAELGR